MLHLDNFLRYFISFTFTALLLINIMYAFNLVGTLGIPVVYDSGITDYSDKYFGISSIIDSFKAFFGNNASLNGFKEVLSFWYNAMSKLDIKNLLGFQYFWGYTVNQGDNFLATLLGIVTVLTSILNILTNVPYIIMVIIYFLLFLFYVLAIVFLAISYAIYLLSGIAYSYMPNTTFPTPVIQWDIDPNTGLPVISNSILPIF